MKTLSKILRGVDTFTQWQGYILCVLLVALIGIVVYDITARQVGMLTVFLFDTEWFLYAAIMMLGMAYAVLKGQHVRVDWITTRFTLRTQRILEATSWGVIVIPCLGFIGAYAWDFFMIALMSGERTITGWHVILWPVKLLVFMGIVLMLPQSVAQLIRSIYYAIKMEEMA